MAYPSQFIRYTWIFGIADTDEVAETGFHVCTIGSPFDAVAYLDALTADDPGADYLGYMANVINNVTSMRWGDYSELNAFKVAAVGTDGNYLTDPYIFEDVSPEVGTDVNVPPQDSVVISLRSGLTFGTANYGRMYIPHTIGDLEAGQPFMETALPAAIAASFAGLVTQANTDADTWTATAGVMNVSKVGSGTKKAVASVGCGNVVDTQRRRRNKLQETYAYSTP